MQVRWAMPAFPFPFHSAVGVRRVRRALTGEVDLAHGDSVEGQRVRHRLERVRLGWKSRQTNQSISQTSRQRDAQSCRAQSEPRAEIELRSR